MKVTALFILIAVALFSAPSFAQTDDFLSEDIVSSVQEVSLESHSGGKQLDFLRCTYTRNECSHMAAARGYRYFQTFLPTRRCGRLQYSCHGVYYY